MLRECRDVLGGKEVEHEVRRAKMVMVVRTPGFARKHFTANDLAGWPNGVRYEIRGRAKRVLRIKTTVVRQAKVVPVKVEFTFS